MEHVPARSLGEFSVQYTDAAREQAARLDGEMQNKMHHHLVMVAAVNPQLHGKKDPGYETQDRRFLEFERLVVTFWLSINARVLTVVNISGGDDPLTDPIPNPSNSIGFIPHSTQAVH